MGENKVNEDSRHRESLATDTATAASTETERERVASLDGNYNLSTVDCIMTNPPYNSMEVRRD